jgi:hypothetical protein
MRVVSKIGFHTLNDMRLQRIHIILVTLTCCNGKMSNSYMNIEENSTNLCSPASDFLETVVVGAVTAIVCIDFIMDLCHNLGLAIVLAVVALFSATNMQ